MNREIKFRGRAKGGFWHFGDLKLRKDKPNWAAVAAWVVDRESVGEFVAMDSSDTPIYENDIVAANYSHYGKYENFVVKKHHLDWFLFYNDLPVERLWWFLKYRKVIVVGNIFDNPELLKGGKDND